MEGDMNRIFLAHDRNERQALVNAAMSLRANKIGEFLD